MISDLKSHDLSISLTAFAQDTIQESATDNQQTAVSLKQYTCRMNYNRIDKFSDTAKTLCARDYKGFGTGFDTMNGVLEVKSYGKST